MPRWRQEDRERKEKERKLETFDENIKNTETQRDFSLSLFKRRRGYKRWVQQWVIDLITTVNGTCQSNGAKSHLSRSEARSGQTSGQAAKFGLNPEMPRDKGIW